MDEKTPERFWASENDIIYTRTGQVGLVFRGQKGVVHNNCFRVIPLDENILDRNYLYWVLTLKSIYNYANSIAAGAAQPDLPHDSFKTIRIPFDDISVQRKIVAILDNYDKAIENNNKRIKILEQMAENLYKEWFVRFRFPGHEDVEFDYQNPRGWIFGDKEQTSKPKTWHFGELRELGEFIRGKNITADKMVEGDIPVISAGLSPSGMHNEANVFGKSLTISASGANAGYLMYHLDSIWAADCSYYQDEKNLWFVYNSLKFLQPVISNMQAGAAQPHVYPKHVNRINIMIPDSKTIDSYCDMVNSIYEQIRVLKIKNVNLIKQRDLLLPHLMSGKLQVK